MGFHSIGVGIGAVVTAATLAATPLAALSMRECSAAYQDARKQGTLGGMTWRDFRKARCRPGATAAPPATTGPAPTGSAYLPGGRAVFPTAISPKYADETPGKARRLTCLDQYRLNKASNANGGLQWVQKGGGFYNECNRRLKAGGKG
jgi:hypothetical protein